MTLHALIAVTIWGILLYFIFSKIAYFLLNILSVFRMHRIEQAKILAELPQTYSGLELPISVLLTTRNDATLIAGAVQALLQLDYSTFEVIVINDGSDDATMAVLTQAFDLHPFPEAYRVQLATQAVKHIYRSTRYPNLRVLDKESGNTADALNAGINASRYPLYCNVSADTLLHRDSLRRIAVPFLNDHTVIAAVSGMRVANGSSTKNGLLDRFAPPQHWLPLFQIIEYLRTSLFAPLGWSTLNGMLIVPAAGIGLFRKENVIAAGGYRTNTTIEHMELIVRMHRLMRKKQQQYRITFIADPVCWRQVPQDTIALKSLRMRWQQGLSDSLNQNLGLLFARNGGVLGYLTFPFFLLFEWLGPAIESFGYLFVIITLACGLISWQAALAFFSVAIGLGILLSASALLLEEMSFHLYPKAADIAILALAAILGNFGYRQLDMGWRALALGRWLIDRQREPRSIAQTEKPGTV